MGQEKKRLPLDAQLFSRALLLAVCDAISVLLCAFLALYIRFDMRFGSIDKAYLESAFGMCPWTILFMWVVFFCFHLYNSLWKYASLRELFQAVLAGFIVIFFQTFVLIGNRLFSVPRSYHFIFGIFFLLFTIGIRFAYRFLRILYRLYWGVNKGYEKNIMLIGAGAAGRLIVDEVKNANEIIDRIACIIDDDVKKHGKYLRGVQIVGGRERIEDAVEKYCIDQIIIAIPSMPRRELKKILEICKKTGCEMKIVPGIYQVINGEVSMSKLRNVEVEDLLGREPISVNTKEIFEYITGKSVLVTGGGGSIGAELCRQIAAHEPKQLIIFDVYENNAYEIQQELKRRYEDELNLAVVIGSVRDSRKIFQVFEQYKPDIVYHAAAHKHVPLMEDSPCEAIKNNVIGTYKTAFAAMTHDCKRFVLISTDKAVRPTNIMGASKRLCEMVIQAFDAKIKQGKATEIPQLFTHLMNEEKVNASVQEALKTTKTEFVAVRFGNVLGSNGSVLPLFRQQIAEGGPVTVTHPDIIRYFMTIPEAVGLVLQAGVTARGGEIFVLDMGEPVRIADLAENMIRCCGFKPDEDIKIVYTGLRPGEKLFEEKLMAEEGLTKTENELIHIGKPIPFDMEQFLVQLEELMEASYKNHEDIRELVKKVVVTYHPDPDLAGVNKE